MPASVESADIAVELEWPTRRSDGPPGVPTVPMIEILPLASAFAHGS
jgi:hypothetical protein